MRKAVVLLNLGGPDSLKSVKPFLFNLFYDRSILNFSNPFRWILAKFISNVRNKKAQKIYALLGGKSPIFFNTQKQAEDLELVLNKHSGSQFKVFCAMRYWHPFISEIKETIENNKFDEVVLLPLYPQFSTTTTLSSFNEWLRYNTQTKVKTICCYFRHEKFLAAHMEMIVKTLKTLTSTEKPYILFSAHSLPQKIVDGGDPYQWQIQETVTAIVEKMRIEGYQFDFEICYQSKVGPLKWLEPSTISCIKKAGMLKRSLVLVPISFVSEHSETLVELDIEYKQFALQQGCFEYKRVLSLGEHPTFIDCLKDLILEPERDRKEKVNQCMQQFQRCYCCD